MRQRTWTSVAIAAIVIGCGASKGSGDEDKTATFTLSVTDAPVDDAQAVVVQFSAVEVQPANGERVVFTFTTPKQIDLLTQAGRSSAELLSEKIAPGEYSWIRLMVDSERGSLASYIQIEGVQYPLWIPSGSESGLKLIHGFTVAEGHAAEFTVDFDLRKSIIHPPGQGDNYMMHPVLRIVDTSSTGELEGEVSAELLSELACQDAGAVYVFAGSDAPLVADGALTSTLVAATTPHSYVAAFLDAGPYTAAFGCSAAPSNNLAFSTPANVTITTGDTTPLNF